MSQVIDNLIAYRVLTMLVKPFNQTDAYKLGIIDENGNNLIKLRDLKTTDQRNAYTYLHRLVFNIKKLINKLPGGESKLKNIIAAFFLFKEAYQTKSVAISEHQMEKLISILNQGVILAEDQLIVEEFFCLMEDGPANAAGPGVSTDQPVIRRKPKRFAKFVVNDDLYGKFANGKAKFRKWSDYLNLEDEGQKMIYDFARKNPSGVIVLHNGKNTKAIRFNRRGGGGWSKLKRPSSK